MQLVLIILGLALLLIVAWKVLAFVLKNLAMTVLILGMAFCVVFSACSMRTHVNHVVYDLKHSVR
jgi:tryptophan-rich sensory protein